MAKKPIAPAAPQQPPAPPPEPGVARRTTTTVTDELITQDPQGGLPPAQPEPEMPPEAPEALIDPIPDEIGALLEELGDVAHKVVVYRYNRVTKRMARLDEWPHNEFSLGMLGDTFGGGTYRIYVFRPNGQMVSSKVVDIDEAKKPKETAPVQVPVYAPAPQQAPDTSRLLEVMMQQQSKSQELVMTMMAKMAETVSAINNRPAQPSVIKDVGDILALQKMLGGDNATTKIEAVLGALRQGMELGQMAGGGEDKGLLDKLVDTFLPALAGTPGMADRLMGALRPALVPPSAPAPQPLPRPAPAAVQIPAPAAPVVPAPAPAAPAEAAPERVEEPSMGMGLNFLVAMYKGPILDMARQNFDESTAADIIVLRIPRDYYPVCLDFVSKSDCAEQVLKFIPDLVPYGPWVTRVLAAGRQALEEELAPEPVADQGAPAETGAPAPEEPAK